MLAWLALLVAFELRAMWLGRGADGGAMTVREQFLAWFALVATVEALLFASPWLTRLTMLVPGDDPMTYETYARDIQLHGLLLKSVEGPYYYQVFYPYFLALIHTLFGEGMFGLVFVQRVLVAFVVWMVVKIAVEIGGERVLARGLRRCGARRVREVRAARGVAVDRVVVHSAAGMVDAAVDSRMPAPVEPAGRGRRTRRRTGGAHAIDGRCWRGPRRYPPAGWPGSTRDDACRWRRRCSRVRARSSR